MAHPSVVRRGEGKILPGDRVEVTEDTIDDTKSGFQVRVSLVVLGSHDLVTGRDRLEYRLIGFMTNTLALNSEVEEGPGAEVSLVPKLWNDHRVSS